MSATRSVRGGTEVDAVVVGAGPNGLAAAVTLARAGLSVHLVERADSVGGGTSSRELTLPGFVHDVCSAVHPLAFESRFFREFDLARRVEFITPEVSFGHPLDGGGGAVAYRDLERTREGLGTDGAAYASLIGPLAERAGAIADLTGQPLLRVPSDPLAAAAFAAATLEQGSRAWNVRFRGRAAPALLTGAAAHTSLPLPSLPSAGAGLALTAYAHARGWPIPRGGSQAIADAMRDDILAHGGRIETGVDVTDLADLPRARATLLDVTPRALVRIAGAGLPDRYRRALSRFHYGNGSAKVDFALSEPVPWANPEMRRAGTLHLGGSREEISAGENAVASGRLSELPYVLASQPSVFDDTRAPAGMHTLWTYTHVPPGSTEDRSEAVIRQIERFAPGFRDTIVGMSSWSAAELQEHNPNYPGGDISAGTPDLLQLVRRPVLGNDPWRTPLPGVYLASASVTPGPGVHGLVGWLAARSALRHEFGVEAWPNLSVGS